MLKANILTFLLFFASLAAAIGSRPISIENNLYMKAFLLYLLFSCLYHHLRITSKNGSTSVDYGISYSLSIGLFTGPLGLFIFETFYRFIVFFYKKITKTADPHEFTDTFYNIGAFVLNNSIAFYLFHTYYPKFQGVPFGFWILMFLLVTVTSVLSDLYLILIFYFLGDIKTGKEAIDFFKSRSVLDMGKLSFTNGLLFLFLQEQKWEMLISLFILNYLVSLSFVSKSQHIQNKIERDRFEQMAYTDFLTGVFNRAFMDKKMEELNQTGEYLGIVVADIDKFKQINDNYNHAVGDQVIQHFAATLKSYILMDDYLFRSGGEEFTLFLRHRHFEQCAALVETILQSLETSEVNVEYKGETATIHYTSSFGLYFFKVNEIVSMEKGYVYADQLLLQSKQLGRNRLSSANGAKVSETNHQLV
ncbi:GGDEF domain-containing protein [Bacillus salipaludis]|uniref:GGDEF domain-containing protein n=1 Tax=Bacillus salipaludis TaxID=2547811 RepID=A0A4R5VZ81_9BACI|nr:GGDEF domain-containing protein [Bacillus salipaludis]MDQ6595284.1 GGDEF domain-containing protein [Bacillus salipaludis]TDK63877.1 GGDEF domain-containing protein [Bacillus salipaludis]